MLGCVLQTGPSKCAVYSSVNSTNEWERQNLHPKPRNSKEQPVVMISSHFTLVVGSLSGSAGTSSRFLCICGTARGPRMINMWMRGSDGLFANEVSIVAH